MIRQKLKLIFVHNHHLDGIKILYIGLLTFSLNVNTLSERCSNLVSVLYLLTRQNQRIVLSLEVSKKIQGFVEEIFVKIFN